MLTAFMRPVKNVRQSSPNEGWICRFAGYGILAFQKSQGFVTAQILVFQVMVLLCFKDNRP